MAKTSIRVVFDRFLLPASAYRQSICVQPVAGLVTGVKDCAHGLTLEPAYDPVLRQVTYRQPATSPGLAAGKRYTVSVFPPPADGTSSGIEAFDGAPLAAAISRDFVVRDAEPAEAKPDPGPTGDRCVAVTQQIFRRTCSSDGCHTSDSPLDHGVPIGAAEGLDFSSNAHLRQTGIGHIAYETETGEHTDPLESSPSRFGRSMPIIFPGRPGDSYLLYKVLANRSNGSPATDPATETQRLTEIERLRAGLVVGMPMPPQENIGNELDAAALEDISNWILQGAPTTTCK